MFEDLQKHLEEYFSNYRQNTPDTIFYGIGHSIGEIFHDKVMIADVGVNFNDSHLRSIASGIGKHRTVLIGIDPEPKYIPEVRYYKGRAQDLPLLPREVDVIIFYDALRFTGVDQNAEEKQLLDEFLKLYGDEKELFDPTNELQMLCSEIERVKPFFVIFTDSTMYFRMQKISGRRNDYELIRSELDSYIDIDFQKRYIKRLYGTTAPHKWMLLIRKN